MKKCPYCGEYVPTAEEVCRFCNASLHRIGRQRWYYKTHWLMILFLSVGPLMLPLVWCNPRFDARKKALATAVILFLSWLFIASIVNMFKAISGYYSMDMFKQL